MSGGISFSKEVYWGKAGWCYRAARDGICDVLKAASDGKELAEELSADSHPAQWCEHLDIEGWPSAKKRLFFDAIHRSYVRYTKNGPVGWHDPSVFPGFLRALEELSEIARHAAAENEDPTQ